MTDVHIFNITDPKLVRLMSAALDSDWGITYITHTKDGKPDSMEVVLDVEDKNDAALLEAIRQ
jgi:hypothetical protein